MRTRKRTGGNRRIHKNNQLVKHGHTVNYEVSPTYQTWQDMKRRCYNINCNRFHRYGGRGIQVCCRWFNFKNFLLDMGEKPKGLSIERINNDGHYMPSNCRWATAKEQAQNRVTNFAFKRRRYQQTHQKCQQT